MLGIQYVAAPVETSIFTFDWLFVNLNQIQVLKLMQPFPYLVIILYAIESGLSFLLDI